MTSIARLSPAPGDTTEGPDSADARTASNLRTFGIVAVGAVGLLAVLPAVGPLCPLRRTTGVPCPMCGMTTGANALARGDVAGAVVANPLAPVLALAVVASWLLLLAGRPTLPIRTRTIGRSLTAALPFLWLYQLHRHDLV